MMFWKLTENVWWGACSALTEISEEVGSVINVAANNDLLYSNNYDPLCLPGKTPYFRMGLRDRDFPDDKYMESLVKVIEIGLLYKPLFVHCVVGMHRSPIVAVIAAMIDLNSLDENTFITLNERCISLNPEIRQVIFFNFRNGATRWVCKKMTHPEKIAQWEASVAIPFEG